MFHAVDVHMNQAVATFKMTIFSFTNSVITNDIKLTNLVVSQIQTLEVFQLLEESLIFDFGDFIVAQSKIGHVSRNIVRDFG